MMLLLLALLQNDQAEFRRPVDRAGIVLWVESRPDESCAFYVHLATPEEQA